MYSWQRINQMAAKQSKSTFWQVRAVTPATFKQHHTVTDSSCYRFFLAPPRHFLLRFVTDERQDE